MTQLAGGTALNAEIIDRHVVHAGWNRLLLIGARTARGTLISRSVEDHGDAAAVLPFDPVRRTCLMVRQLRVPLLLAHGTQTSLEAPAGLLDGDAPADCVRREAMEEAGLRLAALVPVAVVHSMPGVSTERMHLFLAEYGVADRSGAGGGLEAESEEIEVVEMTLAALAAMAWSGDLPDLKTLTLYQALRLARPDLFAD